MPKRLSFIMEYVLDTGNGDFKLLEDIEFACFNFEEDNPLKDATPGKWRVARVGEEDWQAMFCYRLVNGAVKDWFAEYALVGRIWVPRFSMKKNRVHRITRLGNRRQLEWEIMGMADFYDMGNEVNWEASLESSVYRHETRSVSRRKLPSFIIYRDGEWLIDVDGNP